MSTSEPKDDARSSMTACAATRWRRGTDGNMANSRMTRTEQELARTQRRIASGHVSPATENATPGRNSPLNDAETLEWNRLRNIRRRGMMLSMAECDWLL